MDRREKRSGNSKWNTRITTCILSFVLSVCMAVIWLPVTAKAGVTDSGTCGAAGNEGNVTWTVEDGKLTISGSGAMKDYSNNAPWYQYRESITAVEIAEGVTSISSFAFNATGITSITIPASVTTIGNRPFNLCTSLENILVTNGNSAYISVDGILFDQGKTTLIAYPANKEGVSYEIPDSVTVIADGAFSCTHLTDITIPANVNSIGAFAFGKSSITSITVPASVSSIGWATFSGCTSLESVSFEDNSKLTTIEEYLFNKCTSLKSVSFGNNSQLTSLADSTFMDLTSLESVSFGENSKLTSIGNSTFEGCTSLTDITIPAGVTTIGDYAFWDCANLKNITIPAGVTELKQYVFSGCKNLTNIMVPAGVASIEHHAFYDCENLTSITFAENSELISIGMTAFCGCKKLTGITIPAKVTYINPRSTFDDCVSLKRIDVEAGSASYASIDGVLYNKSGTELIRVPEGKGVTSYTIPQGVTTIQRCAFSNSGNLERVEIPDSVESIIGDAFLKCTGLTSVVVPNSVTSIEIYAFSDCNNLTSAFLPSSATIHELAFPNKTTKVKYSVTDGQVTITEISLAEGQTTVDIPDTISGYPVVAVDSGYQSKVGSHTHDFSNTVCPLCGCVQYVSSITLDSSTLTIYVGEGATQLTATAEPDNAADKSVTWTSSNEAAATVDENGNVTAVDKGTATITATANDGSGKTASCVVTVLERVESVDVTIAAPKAGDVLATTASVSATGVAAAPAITWKKDTAEVSGNADYNTAYTASVTLSANAGYVFAENVAVKVNNIEIDSGNITKNENGTITVTYQFAKTDKRTLTSSDFTFAAPESLVYNGSAKAASVTVTPSGVGSITVKYYDNKGNQLNSAPVNAGTYIVKIDVAESNDYQAVSNLTAGSWTFTISPKEIKATDLEFVDTTITKVYDGTTGSNAKVRIKAGVVGTEAVEMSGTSVYDSKDVKTASKITFTPAAITSGNYTIAATETIEHAATITAKPVTGTNQTILVKTGQAKNITYDLSKLLSEGVTGTTTYAVGTVSNENGVLDASQPTGDITNGKLTLHVASVADADKTATVPITFTNDNYTISEATLTIKTTGKIPVTLSGVTCENRVYNGAAYTYTGTPVWKTEDGDVVSGELNEDDTSQPVATTVTYNKGNAVLEKAPTDAGIYQAVFTINSETYVGSETFSFEITKAQITVAAKNKSIYVGDAVPSLSSPIAGTDYTVTGLCRTDGLSGTATMEYAQTPDNTKAGTYAILIRGLTAPAGDNYTLTFTNAVLTITEKPSNGGGSSSGGAGGGGAAEPEEPQEPSTPGSDDSTTSTVTNEDGSTTTVKKDTDASGNPVTTTTTVKTDGSMTEEVKKTATNASGKEVEVTTTTNTDADGNVASITVKSVIEKAEPNTSVTVVTDKHADGKVTEAKAAITKTSNSSKAVLSGTVVSQITEAAGADTNVKVTMTVKDSKGREKYTVKADSKEIVPGNKLYVYKLDAKSGKYVMVNASTYRVSAAGDVTVNMKKKATYELVTGKEAAKISKQILATVKPAKTSKTLLQDKSTTFALSKKLNKENIKKITYAAPKDGVVTVSKKGKITATESGTTTVKATITLKNGKKKTIKMKIKVQ